jgi:pyruvate dehydrogenase E2 component (dihydrolipoamide acetyltransferase)
MAIPVMMPRQGQSVETCIITQWHKAVGEDVSEGDLLFSYETDKAAFEQESPVSGMMLARFYEEGDEVPVLTNVAVIGNKNEDISSFAPETYASASSGTHARSGQDDEETSTVKESEGTTSTAQTPTDEHMIPEMLQSEGRIRISPLARNMAAKAGIDINGIAGTGPQGRIIERDVRQLMQSQPVKTHTAMPVIQKDPNDRPYTAPAKQGVLPEPLPLRTGIDFSDHKISNIRKIIATRMAESLQTAAQLTHHLSADARKILALRKEIKSVTGQPGNADISINDMVCFAVIRALKLHPEINAHFLGNSIRQFHKVHLGFAVDTERGLMVPVLRNADDLNLSGLSLQLKALANDCKTGKINPELLASDAASFTVSNLGAYGIEMFTPVLNLPQVGILGVNTITYRPADLGDGTIGFIPAIGLSLTYDHRAIDGAPASRFLKEIKHQVEKMLTI